MTAALAPHSHAAIPVKATVLDAPVFDVDGRFIRQVHLDDAALGAPMQVGKGRINFFMTTPDAKVALKAFAGDLVRVSKGRFPLEPAAAARELRANGVHSIPPGTTARELASTVAVLVFENAAFHMEDGRLTGSGLLELKSREGSVSGRSYTGDLTKGELELNSQVRFISKTHVLTGDRGTIRFDRDGQIQDVVVRQNVVIEPLPDVAPAQFSRAEAPSIRYDLRTALIHVNTPAVVWNSKGERSELAAAGGTVELPADQEKPARPPFR